ncbi:MAG: MipA/OmpV family protein [Brevundimonas sp.]|uniref:MipA/OmpV family protein n=1 Tax=Brevundimonas sp. TaxID=1871086 RepID=UPI002589E1D1|nr:MipA/OmpV family protein [Brevundimonas sp.]MCV0415764.1 MipA/OmpV family protein [Brevundimonas sp.]
MTGLTPYAPGSGVRNTGVAFLMLTPIGDRWAVATFANAERAMSDVADSPLIQARDEQEMAIAGGF